MTEELFNYMIMNKTLRNCARGSNRRLLKCFLSIEQQPGALAKQPSRNYVFLCYCLPF